MLVLNVSLSIIRGSDEGRITIGGDTCYPLKTEAGRSVQSGLTY